MKTRKLLAWCVAAAAGLVTVAIIMVISERTQSAAGVAAAERAVLSINADLDREPLANHALLDPPDSQPNIVLIVADDLGWRDVGYNHSEIRTPNIDGLAADGITLNRFYVQPACSPTRAALLTGKSPMRLGILSPLSKNNPTGLPLTERTLADRLKAAGYQTALTGKWHLGPRHRSYHPNARGFDHFYGHLTGGVGYYDKVHGGGYDWQRNGVTVRDAEYATHLVAREAVDVIKRRDPNRPLFLYAAFGAPHLPNEAPEATVSSYDHIKSRRRRLHAAMVTELDAAIGAIHAALLEQGIERDTLIWFMSDNGG
ncbi:MAG: sulfatase-like hydrolase/transferase, partial [Pseudomonadota bacterium]